MRTSSTALLAGALAASLLGTTGPASANPEWHGCPVDEFCVWEGPNGTGRVATFRTGTFNVANQGLVNGGRSAWNRTSSKWCWGDAPGRPLFGKYVDSGRQLNNTAVWAAHRPDPIRCIL